MNLDDDFSFPFQPYQIQVNFMKKLFDVLDNQKLGIFESRKEFQFENAIEKKNVNFELNFSHWNWKIPQFDLWCIDMADLFRGQTH